MESFSVIIESLSSFAWPLLIFVAGYSFRRQIRGILAATNQQLLSGAAIKWKDFEFKGVELDSFDKIGATSYTQEPADINILNKRHGSYRKNRNLFLVHRARRSDKLHPITNLQTFDISVYLIPHKSFGKINDVREVQYYFGNHFGLSRANCGTKYIVRNGSDSFAVKINAYGPTLCEARIIFHDSTEVTVSRYLDFEGTGYRFDPATVGIDVRKLQNKLEDNSDA